MADTQAAALQRAASVTRIALDQQTAEPEHDAVTTLWIMARSVLRILGPTMASRDQ